MKKFTLLFTFITTSILHSQNWGEQILTQPNPNQSNAFGYSVAIDNDYAVISSAGENNGTGSVHVYKRDANGNWNYHQKLEAFAGQAIDEFFGYAVALQEDFLFVSSPRDRLNEINFTIPAGSVFIFKKNVIGNFEPLQRIRASDAAHTDSFGSALDVGGDYLVVGAQYEDEDENGLNTISSAGSAYIFKRDINDIWNQVQKIVPSVRTNRAYFGSNLAMHGDYFIAGVRGSVFVFKKDGGLNTWSEIQILQPTGPSEEFGVRDLDIQDNYIAIGADNVDTFDSGNWYRGYVYVFKNNILNNTWSQNQIIRLPNSARFGQGISMDSDYLLISDPEKSVRNNGVNVLNVGKSYLYKREGQFGDQYEPRETIVASQVQTNSFIGTGMISNNEFANYATAIADNHFIIGAPRFAVDDGGVAIPSAGVAFISGNFNNVLAEDIFWTGNVSNDWNNSLNWLPNTVPTQNHDAIIEDVANSPIIASGQNHTINNMMSFDNLDIQTNASLTINGNLDQRNTINISSSIDTNGSLILKGNQTNQNPSNTTYNRYVFGNNASWHLISSPLSNVDIDIFAANEPLAIGQNANNRGLSWYNNINENWEYYQNGAVGSGNFVMGKGYGINTSENTSLQFQGKLMGNDINNIAIPVNANGWNLVGNPYPAFLNANNDANAAANFLSNNLANLDPIAANIYLWNPNTNSYDPIGNGLAAKYIAPGQAFFLKAKAGGGIINITKNMQTHRNENLFLKNKKTHKIVLQINNNSLLSETTVAFKEGMTNGLDISYDAAVFSGVSNNFSLYTQLLESHENIPFAIQFLPNLNDNAVTIPVGILLNEEKEITLSIKESNLDSEYKIYLEDRLLNKFTDITNSENYTFIQKPNAGLGRFFLQVQKGTLSINTIEASTIKVFINNNANLEVTGISNGILQIYDINGKRVLDNKKINLIEKTIELPKVNKGVYIVKIIEKNGAIFSKKLIL